MPAIDEENIALFCRNASHLKVVSTLSIWEEYNRPHPQWLREFSMEGTSEHHNAYAIYLLFRATELFYHIHRRYPGEHESEMENDTFQLRIIVRDALRAMSAAGQGMAVELGLVEKDIPNNASGSCMEDNGGNTGSNTPINTPMGNLDDWVQEL